ncbi:26S proteasome subunit P45, partial [Favolaschia claudopus]
MRFSSAIALASSFAAAALAMTPAIIQPADGTHVAPGQSFPFEYQIIADYGVSSYNYTVYLFTTPPLAFMTSQNYGAGHYFGRFAQPNYPGNPSPSNLPPPKLVMPNFSTSRGGFGAGASASNATYYLAVFEEYATGD